jgi:hypothetical protein
MQSHNGLNVTPLDPPLFWLDNIFNGIKYQTTQILEGNVLNLACWINATDCILVLC